MRDFEVNKCRACLRTDKDQLIHRLDMEETQELFELTQIPVGEDDRLPRYLCANCYNQCVDWKEFLDLVHESNETLHSELAASEVIVEEELEFVEVSTHDMDHFHEEIVENDSEDEANDIIYESEEDWPQKETNEDPSEGDCKAERKFMCSICGKQFSHRSTCRRHELSHHQKLVPADKKTFECSKCNRQFTHKSNLRRHEKIHLPKQSHLWRSDIEMKPFKCSKCDKRFTLKCNLRRHEKYHSFKHTKPFQCSTCGKSYSLKCNLKRHEKGHSDISEIFKCSKCDQQFTNPSNRRRHEKKHANNTLKTGKLRKSVKRLAPKNNLVAQEAPDDEPKQSENEDLTCKFCNQIFAVRSEMLSHLLNHSKPYKCSRCDKSFISEEGLGYHELTHTRENKPFACNICNSTFTLKSNLKRHSYIHID